MKKFFCYWTEYFWEEKKITGIEAALFYGLLERDVKDVVVT